MIESDESPAAGLTDLERLLVHLPTNWGRWGEDDERGALNFIGVEERLRAVLRVAAGRVVTLGLPIGARRGDPVFPGRPEPLRLMVQDQADYEFAKAEPLVGGLRFADDHLSMPVQGTTHFDALAHAWCGNQVYNGAPAGGTVGSLEKADAFAIADGGVVGRGVLLDVPRHRGVDCLEPGSRVDLDELLAVADSQDVHLGRGDILCVRTGHLEQFYLRGKNYYYRPFDEPGLAFSPELVRWFHETEIAVLATDTIANEPLRDAESGAMLPLHAALMWRLGVAFNEMCLFDRLAEACADEHRYEFLYVAGPLKIVGGTGACVNPVAIL